MGRRRPWNEAKRRTVLGWNELGNARAKLATLQANVIGATCEFSATTKEILDWFVDPDKLALIQEARPYLDRQYTYGGIDVQIGSGCNLEIGNWKEYQGGTPTPSQKILRKAPLIESAPLFDYVKEVNKVRQGFALCKHVLNWLDEHATPGAIKYYWPCVLSLCHAEDIQNAGDTFRSLANVGPMLTHFRTTSDIIAMALLAPTYTAPERDGEGLTFALKFGEQRIGPDIMVDILSWTPDIR